MIAEGDNDLNSYVLWMIFSIYDEHYWDLYNSALKTSLIYACWKFGAILIRLMRLLTSAGNIYRIEKNQRMWCVIIQKPLIMSHVLRTAYAKFGWDIEPGQNCIKYKWSSEIGT